LHGDAAPIDWATRLAIDRQWRLITEVKRLDPQPRPICATSPAVIHVPSHTRPQWKLPPKPLRGARRSRQAAPDRNKKHDDAAATARQLDRQRSSSSLWRV